MRMLLLKIIANTMIVNLSATLENNHVKNILATNQEDIGISTIYIEIYKKYISKLYRISNISFKLMHYFFVLLFNSSVSHVLSN